MVSGGRAVVVGAGIAGLCAARVLSDHYSEVVVVERDELPDGPHDRKLVPQGPFVHVLLTRGQRLLDGWFPGLGAAMDRLGATVLDWADETAVFHHGAWMPRFRSDLKVRSSTRACLEYAVRSELAKVRGVRFVPRTRVLGLVQAGGRITAVRLHPEADAAAGQDAPLSADLVVDCSGRGSRAGRWLEELGYGSPRSTVVKAATTYATQLFDAPDADFDFRCMYIMPHEGRPTSGLIYPIEGGRWGVNLFAYDGSSIPPDEEFVEFATSLARPELYDALRLATPASPVRRYKSVGNRRIHFDEMPRWPQGLVVLGDAGCALNPVYGQGITLAAMGVDLFGRELARRRFDAGRFRRRLARMQSPAWEMSTIEDLRWPTTTGMAVDFKARAAMSWTDRVHTVAQNDLQVYRVLADVIHLLRPATDLVKPRIAWRVWRRGGAEPESVSSSLSA